MNGRDVACRRPRSTSVEDPVLRVQHLYYFTNHFYESHLSRAAFFLLKILLHHTYFTPIIKNSIDKIPLT